MAEMYLDQNDVRTVDIDANDKVLKALPDPPKETDFEKEIF